MRARDIEKLKSRALLFEAENYRLRQVLEVIRDRHPEIKEAKWALEQPGVAEKIKEMEEQFPPKARNRGRGKYRTAGERVFHREEAA